jgi:hypothetical protein
MQGDEMPDYRTMYDREHIAAWDLPGDVNVKIVRVECKELTSQRGKNKRPILFFEGKEKSMVINKTNGKTISNMYGLRTEDWIGKWVTLFKSSTSAGGETVDCIRIRPEPPRARSKAPAPSEVAND